MSRKILVSAALAAASVLVLAGCAGATLGSSGSSAAADGKVQVVASTNVYGDIAAAIGGDRVDVTSIISSTAQDPHSYEASAEDQLTISRAGLIIENGGGYDSFMDSLIDATGTEAPVITAVEFSHDYPGAEAHSDDDHDHGDDGVAPTGRHDLGTDQTGEAQQTQQTPGEAGRLALVAGNAVGFAAGGHGGVAGSKIRAAQAVRGQPASPCIGYL